MGVERRVIQIEGGSGPIVAKTFHRLLALIFLVAWWSLQTQLDVLVGRTGLLPAAPYLEFLHSRGASWFAAPTLFWWGASDALLHAGVWAGIVLSLAAVAGVVPRVCIVLSTILYLSYVTIARTFLSFQWDNLLLECGALAIFLPRDRPARWIHFLFRVLLFKLYWESGIAKYQSHLRDWHDGSAMTFYYETAPLPTWLAWYAQNLPQWWHHFESRGVLVLELLLPFGIFGPRRLRQLLFILFTGFQIVNAATANYGFFCYLAAALHVFLLDDSLLARRPLAYDVRRALSVVPFAAARVGALFVTVAYLSLSVLQGLSAFGNPGSWIAHASPILSATAPFRLVNTYHLFSAITRERIEPEFQAYDGQRWSPLHLRFKAGDPFRAPRFVAPHQPRVDFQLWFYGLSFQRQTPEYVRTLLDRLCNDPKSIAGLFRDDLPIAPQAIHIRFFRYRFTDAAVRSADETWWTREYVGTSREVPCER